MGKVIGIVNQKGGVGKTTSTINLAAALTKLGQKVLVTDFDPQANLTAGILNPYPGEIEYTITEMMADIVNRKPVAYEFSSKEGFDIIPSKIELCSAEITLQTVMSRETVLRRVLDPVRNNYDYILIDCAPSLGILNINALVAADSVIVPVTPDYFAPKGLEQLLDSISGVQEALNPNLRIDGVLLTKVDNRAAFYKNVVDFVVSSISQVCKVFDTQIPISVASAQAPAELKSIFEYNRNTTSAKAYTQLAAELTGIDKQQVKKAIGEYER